ncbi:hypothetical protein JR316_0003935 [Psilocybe cubensis]|uniref:Uncharacterized protein n=2 Tax=Psilocybe cubensis TaxID=181762 RepID=A0A8H7Y656_PSICU|nr:hypothetical protein JR316_0003935 [Psilocybe cubensis]KAH9484453.1 hypothetical protein JR316_0003935 [Psilocybe cubensis]
MSVPEAPPVLNIHTPTSSFAIIHSVTQETLLDLYNKLSRKAATDYYGERVGPGWLKYEYNEAIWNLDDDSDYTIFVWRRQQQIQDDQQSIALTSDNEGPPVASTSRAHHAPPSPPKILPPKTVSETPTLYLHDPRKPLPAPPAYLNPAYYAFQPSRAVHHPTRRSPASSQASTNKRSKKGKAAIEDNEEVGIAKFKKEFERFHSENGVRTVMGSIGPVQNVRMLLKSGYRHVYISRKFAAKHGFIPPDTAPGSYGYGGLVNIGEWPITLIPSVSQSTQPLPGYLRPDAFTSPPSTRTGNLHASPSSSASPLPLHNWLAPPPTTSKAGSIRSVSATGTGKQAHENVNHHTQASNTIVPKTVSIQVYLAEEPHFDVVLGRSFFEKRQVKTTSIDPTDVVCLDTGEKIECELVILKDGRGEIVTVT